MKIFIILATVLNVFLMTHSSEEKIYIELEKNTITDQKNTDVRINMKTLPTEKMTDEPNDYNSNTYVINPEEINVALHTPPTWFANLDQEDQDKMVALLSQAINQYGSFGKDVKQDLIEKFQIKDWAAEELYKFVYHSQENHQGVLTKDDEITRLNAKVKALAEVSSSSKDTILAIIKKRGSHDDYKVPSCAQMNGREESCAKETGNCKWDPRLETCKDGPGLPRTFPLFTTFNYGETTQATNILIELKEERAIELHMMSNTFKDICNMAAGDEHNEYCEAVYGNENSAMQYDQDRVNSCKQVRSVDFTGDKVGAHFNQVHFTHMKKILEYVRTKGGVAPPTTSKSYIQKVTATSIDINPEYMSSSLNDTNFDLTFVNGIWDNHKQDVGYILNAAMYLDITCLSQLMGARIAQRIEATSTHDAKFGELASIKLDNAFLHTEL